MAMPAWLTNVTLLLLLVPLLAQGLTCPKQCKTCLPTRMECPRFALEQKGGHVDVRCNDWNAYDFGDMESDFGGLRPFVQLSYIRCAIPRNRSLSDTLAFLGPLAKVEQLFFVGNGQHHNSAPLAPILFEGLDSLSVLSLKTATQYPITTPDLFLHVPQLRWLDLREYGGSHLPEELLRHLPALETLEIRQNPNLEVLPPGLYADLPQLTKVIIFGNGLTQLERFTGSPRLASIDLSANRLTELAADMFTELPELKELQLRNNRLATLPGTMLRANKLLERFDASNQRTEGQTVVPDDLFAGLTQLIELNLSGTGLQTLPDELLQDQRNLRILKLSRNNLTTLNKYVLQNLNALEELHLDHNRLQNIDKNTFAGQRDHLRKLLLNHNNISLYDAQSGSDIGYLDGQPYKMQQTPFSYLSKIVELNLSHNAIVKVFHDFTLFMPMLGNLDLSHNSIQHLLLDQLQFASKNVAVLDLSGNRIRSVNLPKAAPQIPDHMPSKIVLKNNPLQCDCDMHPFVRFVRHTTTTVTVSRFELEKLTCNGPPALRGTLVAHVPPMALVCGVRAPELCPSECSCQIRPEDRALVVDCSSRNLTTVPELHSPDIIGYDALELLLQNNRIAELPDGTDLAVGWASVRLLNLSSNRLADLTSAVLSPRLEVIDVSGNQLHALDAQLSARMQQNKLNVSLAGNPWLCECGAPLLLFAQDNVKHIADYSRMECAGGRNFTSGLLSELCAERSKAIVAFSCAVASFAFLLVVCIALYYRYQHELKVWLFMHNMLQWMTSEEEVDRDKQYDAFVSYSHKDEAFITEHLVPTLERPPMNFRVCWHVRDFMPGEMISAQITKAVEESRRTIIVLSANYLESVWGQMEFKTAYLQSIEDKRNRVIAIIYDDIGNVEDLDQELRAYLKTNTYLRWGDPWFWDKLRYAMPHPRLGKGVQITTNMRMASMDKLDLIKPTQDGSAQMDGLCEQSTPPIQQIAKGVDGVGNPLSKLHYTPSLKAPVFTISSNRIDMHIPESP